MRNSSKKLLAWLVLVVNFVAVVLLWFENSGYQLITSDNLSFQFVAREISKLSALLAMLSILAQLILIARTKFLEDAFGLNKLIKAHKWFGILSLSMVLIHVSLFMGSFYYQDISQMINSYISSIFTLEDLKSAALAYAILWMIAITSAMLKLKAMKYRYWYVIHILTYSVPVLAIGHQIKLGSLFVDNLGYKIYWLALFVITLLVVFYCRFVRIWLRYKKYRFTVESIVPNNHDTFSFRLKFRYPGTLNFQPGQFAKFIFLQKGLWQEMHPFSFSDVTRDSLRVTVKASGPYTAKLKEKLKPGTRVIIDGAYGKFTAEAYKNKKVLMIAGGVGITPVIAVSKVLNREKRDVKLMYFANTKADFIFRSELEGMFKPGNLKFYASQEGDGFCTQECISKFNEDIVDRMIYLCGPPAMMKSVKKELKRLKVSKKQIITEQFGF